MRNLFVRQFNEQDRPFLEQGIEQFKDAELELPFGFMAPQVETAVVVKGKNINEALPLLSLTGTLAVVLDPALKVPGMGTPEEYLFALIKAEAILTYMAQKELGARESYVAIARGVDEESQKAADGFIRILQRLGYEETVQNCRVFRRVLDQPDTRNVSVESAKLPSESEFANETSTVAENS